MIISHVQYAFFSPDLLPPHQKAVTAVLE